MIDPEDDRSVRRGETPLPSGAISPGMLTDLDLVFILLLLFLLGLFFFAYLLVRRTLMGLREGYQDGQRR
ncbi:hypothetical protein AArcSl_0150 [Halalkaliarchaeum desulfuricum]|uniref:Uncharacterized protein n=1 Tax=Halalkaliarchaeum desulfuricum TaxID=2055893 RepID=A0A343TFD4_9EURY|nr:hypothetical protein AArcSl_0150 [Halalkaliarchaeum desulfuricum]